MRVLHILNTCTFSGAENVVCQIIKMFENEQDIDMAYCSPKGNIRDALIDRGIDFCPLNRLSVDEVKRVIGEYRPDIIHAHDMRAGFFAALACKKIPLICHIHNNAFDSRKISVKSVFFLFAAAKARHIFWVSESAKNGYRFKNLVAKKSSVLVNVVDRQDIIKKKNLDANNYDYDVVYLGRFAFEKNPQRFIKILEQVVTRIPNLKVGLIGTGPLLQEVEQISFDKNLSKNIDFLGFMSNPYKILDSAKVMIMTSRWEGTPMCALEALALSTPIVSTPTDGIKKLITNGVHGFLSDNDDELSQHIYNICTDYSLKNKLTENIEKDFYFINNIDEYKKNILNSYLGE